MRVYERVRGSHGVSRLFEKATFAHLTTITPKGKPHSTPVWIDYDDEFNQLLVNTERGRRKERNVAKNPAVAVSMTDPTRYRFSSRWWFSSAVGAQQVLLKCET